MKKRIIGSSLVLLASASLSAAALAAYTPPGKGNPDWPCQQILVSHLSPAQMWTGPSIQGTRREFRSAGR